MTAQGKEAAMSLVEQIEWIKNQINFQESDPYGGGDTTELKSILSTLKSLQAPVSLPPMPERYEIQDAGMMGWAVSEKADGKYCCSEDYDALHAAASQLAAQVGALRNPTDEQLTAAVIAWFGTTANPPPIVDDSFKDRMRAAINALAGEGK